MLFFTDPMDEMLVNTVPEIEGLKFQDVAKDGLELGDDDADTEEEELKTRFEPLATFLKKQLATSVDKVVVSTRLTSSPCVVVAGKSGYSGNMERLVSRRLVARFVSALTRIPFADRLAKPRRGELHGGLCQDAEEDARDQPSCAAH